MSEQPDIEEQIKRIRKQADRIRLKREKLAQEQAPNPNAVVLQIASGSPDAGQNERRASKSENRTSKSENHTNKSENRTGKSEGRTAKSVVSNASFLVSVDPSVISRFNNDETEMLEEDLDNGNDRQSDLCCGCCCDLVKACVLSNAFFVCMLTFLITVSLLEIPYFYLAFSPNSSKEYYDDDIYEDVFFDGAGKVTLMRSCAGLLFGLIGMIGAVRFEKWAVLCTAVGYILYALSSILQKSVPHSVIAAFMTYPNVALFMALRSGTMTKDSYMSGTEAHCCIKVGGEGKTNATVTSSGDLNNQTQ